MKFKFLTPVIILGIALLINLASCKKETALEPVKQTPTVETVTAQKDCYVFEKNGSKINLQLEQNGTEANGILTYSLAEKDSNKGTLKGKIENNILIANYTFQSEGTESTRQVAFQFKDNQWIEGYGDMNEEGTHFKDVSQIKFTSSMPLSKTDCTE